MPAARPHYGPVSRAEFERFAVGLIRKRDRDMAYAWIQACEQHGHWFPSAANAVHVWTVRRIARRSPRPPGTAAVRLSDPPNG